MDYKAIRRASQVTVFKAPDLVTRKPSGDDVKLLTTRQQLHRLAHPYEA